MMLDRPSCMSTPPCALALALLASGCDAGTKRPGSRPTAQPASAQPASAGPGWVLVYHEDFEDPAALGAPTAWARDTHPDGGTFSDRSDYFVAQHIEPPVAYRRSQPFGEDGWLTIESCSRSADTEFADQTAVVDDPGGGSDHVLRLRSPEHTDATVVRPTRALHPPWMEIWDGARFVESGERPVLMMAIDGSPGAGAILCSASHSCPWPQASGSPRARSARPTRTSPAPGTTSSSSATWTAS
jgi:hypothetical protein